MTDRKIQKVVRKTGLSDEESDFAYWQKKTTRNVSPRLRKSGANTTTGVTPMLNKDFREFVGL
jgi:hypothetical protein